MTIELDIIAGYLQIREERDPRWRRAAASSQELWTTEVEVQQVEHMHVCSWISLWMQSHCRSLRDFLTALDYSLTSCLGRRTTNEARALPLLPQSCGKRGGGCSLDMKLLA
jgi:hypothetical protein